MATNMLKTRKHTVNQLQFKIDQTLHQTVYLLKNTNRRRLIQYHHLGNSKHQ